MKIFLAAATLLFYLLHQDFWLWRRAEPLVFGFLPVGLFYHACYCLVAAAWMAVLIKYAWPTHLDANIDEQPEDAAR